MYTYIGPYSQRHLVDRIESGSVTSVVRALPQVNGRWQNHTPLTKLTPLNRQSPNVAHVTMSSISAHMPHLVKIA